MSAILCPRTAAICFILTLFPFSAFAQEYRGRIQGTVLDGSQAAVAQARITLTNLGTGVSRKTQTNAAGYYLFDLAEPARYSLSIVADGFAEFHAPSVLLQQRGDVTV
ncbi:MAG TPA: carboxypeptidase-like regulatory domain-containing protein, partial [Terriglobales bacterium]|nr:carboxypeptidase-like regulatory domain-containing protein [Terriglobales bacterium]